MGETEQEQGPDQHARPDAGPGAGLGAGLVGASAGAERTLWHLNRVAERLCARVSTSRQRQLRWIVGELSTYQDTDPAPSLSVLFSTDYLHGYLHAADAGKLRRRGALNTPSPPGAARARRACVEMLAAAAGVPAPDVGIVAAAKPRPKVSPMAAERAMRILLAEARDPGAYAGLVRAVFVATLVHHHDLRTGEIAALTMDDLTRLATSGPDDQPDVQPDVQPDGQPGGWGEAVALTYQPAAPGVGPSEPVDILLVPVVVEMLSRWLVHREALIPVPRVQHLLVSVRGNHDHGVHKPAGLPLRARGLMRAHERMISDLNETLFERYGREEGYAPLPRTLGELRPAVLGVETTTPPATPHPD